MLVTQHSPGVGRRLDEQPVLDGDQLDRTTGKARPAVGVVDNPIFQHVGLSQLGHRPLAQGRPDPRRKLIRREGFDDVIHGPHIEGPAISSSRSQVEGEDNRQVARSEMSFISLIPSVPGDTRSSRTRSGISSSTRRSAPSGSPVTIDM